MGMNFEVTALKGVNKVGNIKRLDNNYLEVILGALEFDNTGGAVYDQRRGEQMIAANSLLQKRIASGYLRGEWGHPKDYDYPNYRDFVRRIHNIEEKNWAIHIRRVWIVPNYQLPNGQRICAIMGEICSTGGRRADFDLIMANPDENLAFSIRSMATDRVVGGKVRKYIDNIITWDIVNDPGISAANKFTSPSCESDILIPVHSEIIKTFAPSQGSVSLESNLAESVKIIKERVAQANTGKHSALITKW